MLWLSASRPACETASFDPWIVDCRLSIGDWGLKRQNVKTSKRQNVKTSKRRIVDPYRERKGVGCHAQAAGAGILSAT
jgi:hypothetical protein